VKNSFINKLIKEFKSYSTGIKAALVIMIFLSAGFVVSGLQILISGLGCTNMSNTYPFGQWIIGDLCLVSLGGGAFTIGFIFYIFKNKKLAPIINSTVLIGFLCYLFTFIFLMFDIGQPLRGWFGYVYPNWGKHLLPNSMLTEVIWCLTVYFIILSIELAPIAFKHKLLKRIQILNHSGNFLHDIMWIFAILGTFLSFFHQASLGGGMWGTLYAKASWFRPHFFFLAVAAAIAGGTSFMTLCAWFAGRILNKNIPSETIRSMAKISGIAFICYFLFRIYDIMMMSVKYVPSFDRDYTDLMHGYYGWWMIIAELLFAVSAIILLVIKKLRLKTNYIITGFICGTISIIISKLSTVLQGSSVPNFPWEEFSSYNPSIQEWFITLGSLSVMIMIYMWCAKYLPLFQHAGNKNI
jgi:menaquinone reductase, integral membrane subunit